MADLRGTTPRAVALMRLAVPVLALLAAQAHAITGQWGGELAGNDGERITVTYGFSPRGALIVQLPAQQGYRAIELTHAGQTDSWLAPNGRAASGRVVALDAGPAHFNADVSVSSGGEIMQGVLRQEHIALQLRFVQQGDRVIAEVWTRTEVTVIGGLYGPKPPDVSSVVHRGVLSRAW